MKLIRILAIVPLVLMSLMNVGYPFGTHSTSATLLAIAVVILGVAGLVAAFGLARNTGWGIPAALTVAGINVVAAITALVSESEGAIIGLLVSTLALVLVFVAGSGTRNISVARS